MRKIGWKARLLSFPRKFLVSIGYYCLRLELKEAEKHRKKKSL